MFFLFNLFFYWRIIALQNFAVFCQTSTWISHRNTYNSLPFETPSHLPPHSTPLGWYRAPVWVSWAIQLILVGYLFYIFKSRDITLPTKVRLVKAMVFPVVMYECESWTVKKAERRRIDDFELWCWRRLLRVPWTARRSNQSIIKEISPGCSLEGMMLKLKLQYFGHLMWRVDSLEKTLMLGGIEGRRRGQQRMRWLDGITDSMDVS